MSIRLTDDDVEQVIGRLLQVGVLLAALVTAIGGTLLLCRHWSAVATYSTFRGEPDRLRSLIGIVQGVGGLHSDSIVQLGLVLLIATPVTRVAFTLVAFLIQRDRMYVGITLIVLALLVYGLFFGTVGSA